MSGAISYVVITPVRDEERYIEKTIESMEVQTILPQQWIIVDDGSTDSTPQIVSEHANRFPWISLIRRRDRGFRKNGGGVIEAFYDGYAAILSPDFHFLIKLDGDLSFKPDYFERCFYRFQKNQRLGIGGGLIENFVNGRTSVDENPKFHVRGATKIYRAECWRDIGSLIKAPGWDTIDETKANMMGWQTETFPEVTLVQHKSTGSSEGTWKNWVKNGQANFITGYHPLFFISKCLIRLFKKPYVYMAAGLLWGFFAGYWDKTLPKRDFKLVRYIRKQQINRLLLRKSIWK